MTTTHSLVLALVLPLSATAGEWDAVSYHFTPGEGNTVKGPNEAFTSVRPGSGAWTASFGVSNHFANLKGEQIRVYSESQVAFHDYNAASGHAGRSGHVVFKIRLSEPITSAVWQIGPHGRNVVRPAKAARQPFVEWASLPPADLFRHNL